VAGYEASQDPATYILVTPAQKVATNGSGQVVSSTVIDKAGYALSGTSEDAVVNKNWDEALADHLGVGSMGKTMQEAADMTGVAAAVWDEARAGHVAPGSFGEGVPMSADGMDEIVIEPGMNARQALAIIASAVAGQLSGANTNNVIVRAANDPSTIRLNATVDANGNRTVVILTIPA